MNSFNNNQQQGNFNKAIRTRSLKCINTLLNHPNVDININNGFPISQALINRSFEVIEILLNSPKIKIENINYNSLVNSFDSENENIINLVFSQNYWKETNNKNIHNLQLLIKYNYNELFYDIILANKNIKNEQLIGFFNDSLFQSNLDVIKFFVEQLNIKTFPDNNMINETIEKNKKISDYLWYIKEFRQQLKINNPQLFNKMNKLYSIENINNF
jgi:hypothetical protein